MAKPDPEWMPAQGGHDGVRNENDDRGTKMTIGE